MAFRSMAIFLALLSILMSLASGATDLTRLPGASGEAVVMATLAQIHESCIFENDYLFLRRLAYVASDYGDKSQTFRSGYDGGIWQISRMTYELTLNLSSVEHGAMKHSLNVDWTQTQWQDLRKPLYSGIAAMLTLMRLAPIPKDLQSQAKFYQTRMAGDEQLFLSNARNIDVSCKMKSLDMAFVLDASGSINRRDFERSTKFTATVIGSFTIKPSAVRVALSSFSYTAYEHFGFLDYSTSESAQNAVMRIHKSSGGTNTNLALHMLRTSVFTRQKGSRPDAARIAIIQTDGQSNNKKGTIEASEKVKEEGITVFAIGLGTGIDKDELKAIASPPSCTHVRLLNDFTELDSIVSDIKSAACKAETVQETNTTNNYKCRGQHFIKIVPDKETSIVTRPKSGKLKMFGSFKITQPNEAFSDFTTDASDDKPVVIFVSDSDQPLYLSVVDELDKGNDCNSTYLVKTIPSNELKKTGATNLCIKGSKLKGCSDIDFVESGDYVKFNSTQDDDVTKICNDGVIGHRPHPDNITKYVYCAPQDEVYVVTCPDGFAYLDSQKDCSAPASLEEGAVCKVCSKDNWEIGLRKFPVASDAGRYVNCLGVEQCGIEECGQRSRYIPDDQTCSKPAKASHTVHGSVLINFVIACTSVLIIIFDIMH